jgi:hypothetical protein
MSFVRWRSLIAIIAALACATVARAQVSVTGEVHWDQSQNRNIPGDAYGLNVWQGFDPNQAGTPGNATYKNNVAAMKPGIIRYHSWEMLQASTTTRGWVTGLGTSAVGWDKAKIGNALNGAYSFGPRVMINIPGYPDQWKLASGKLDPARYTDFANWCALLVQYVNVELGKNVKYWEILNEPDDQGYNGRTDFQEVGRIWAQAAAAMKAKDPTIICGGPALARAWDGQRDNVRGFLDTAGSNLGFISYHAYGTGSASTSTQSLYDAGANIWGPSYWVTSIFWERGQTPLPRYHDELNVNSSQSQNNLDQRTFNEKGMVFNALALLQLATYGYTDGVALWNESDGWNGIMDGGTAYTRRPTSYLVEELNRDGFGTVTASSSSDDSKVRVYALKSGNYVKLILVNRSETTATVQFTSITGLPAGAPDSTAFTTKVVAGWNGGGIFYPASATLGQLKSGYSLSSDTVTFLLLDTNSIPSTQASLNVAFAAAPSSLNLTSEGTSDWAHWGFASGVTTTWHSMDRKGSGGSKISDFTILGGADAAEQFTDSPTLGSWTDGTPNTTATGTQTGVSVYRWWATNTGLRITVPADTTSRTLRLYCGTYNANGKVVASLSSASGVTPVTVTHVGQGYRSKDGVYTITYRANGPGQTLTVDVTVTDNLGGYSPSTTRLFGATLQ